MFRWIGKLCGAPQRRRGKSVESKLQPIKLPRLEEMKRSQVQKETVDLNEVIKTSVCKRKIQVSKFTPRKEKREETKFRCSICYMFFSDILQCSECKNYICIFDLEKFMISVNSATCMYCSSCPVTFTDVDRKGKKLKKYLSDSYKSSSMRSHTENRGSEHSSQGNVADEYWRSHKNLTRTIKFISINDEESSGEESKVQGRSTKVKIMELDPEKQTLTPMGMAESKNTHSEALRSGEMSFRTPKNTKPLRKRVIKKNGKEKKRRSPLRGCLEFGSQSRVSQTDSKNKRSSSSNFYSNPESQVYQPPSGSSSYPPADESSTSQEEDYQLVSTVKKETIVTVDIPSEIQSGRTPISYSSEESMGRETSEEKVRSRTTSNYTQILPSKLSKNSSSSSRADEFESEEERVSGVPKITPQVEVWTKESVPISSERTSTVEVLQIVSRSDSKKTIENGAGTIEKKKSNRVMIKSTSRRRPRNGRPLKKPSNSPISRITNVKRKIKLPDSDLQLQNKAKRISIYGSRAKKNYEKINTEYFHTHRGSLKTHLSTPQFDFIKSREGTNRGSDGTFNPFKDKVLRSSSQGSQPCFQYVYTPEKEEIKEESFNKFDQSFSGSEYEKDHILAHKNHWENNESSDKHRIRPTITVNHENFNRLKHNRLSEKETNTNTGMRGLENLMANHQEVDPESVRASTGCIQTVSSAAPPINPVPRMEIKENIRSSPIRGSNSSKYNYNSTRKNSPARKKRMPRTYITKKKNFRQDSREKKYRKRMR